MILQNCSKKELINRVRDKRTVLFGCGRVLDKAIERDSLLFSALNISFLIDNSTSKRNVTVFGKEYPVFPPDKLREENSCTVIIMSSKYYREMYQQLLDMSLSDNVECYIYPMIRISSHTIPTEEEHNRVLNGTRGIPKTIHSFWFSGEKKPDAYQKCIDSWKRFLPEYEIKEWNLSNYDIEKNEFMKTACQKRKWAFVSDYARLDVISTYGGIYMDMDVELIKDPDELLHHEAVFSFNMNDHIDLAMFASTARIPILETLMSMYDEQVFDDSEKAMSHFSQPGFVESSFLKYGINMDGRMQWIDDMVFLPKTYFMPLDMFTYLPQAQSEYTYAIHWCNGGWRDEKSTPEQVKRNRMLWDLFNSNNGGNRSV